MISKSLRLAAYSLLFLLGIVALGYYVPRTSFYTVLAIFGGCFIIYWRLCRPSYSALNWKRLLFLALALRLVLLFSFPQWSEDYIRFLWDGQLTAEGYNPYQYTPVEALEQLDFKADGLMEKLFPLLNSSTYYSVYPPSNQLMFFLAASLSEENVFWGVLILRLIIIAFEMGVFYFMLKLLIHLGQPPQKMLLYALNPLVIMEVTGNLHFEGMVLAFILAALYFLLKGNFTYSGGGMAVAAGIKLTPLMLFPAFLSTIPRKAYLRFSVGALIILLMSLAPLLGRGVVGFGQSLKLYGTTFEFNASLYYLMRQVGFWTEGYNTIETLGPSLKVVTLLLILGISFRRRNKDVEILLESLLIIYWVYFLFNTVVHPWYIIPAIGISVLTEKKAFIFWSFLIMLSYNAYQHYSYSESTLLLFLQYSFLGFALWKDGFHRNHLASC